MPSSRSPARSSAGGISSERSHRSGNLLDDARAQAAFAGADRLESRHGDAAHLTGALVRRRQRGGQDECQLSAGARVRRRADRGRRLPERPGAHDHARAAAGTPRVAPARRRGAAHGRRADAGAHAQCRRGVVGRDGDRDRQSPRQPRPGRARRRLPAPRPRRPARRILHSSVGPAAGPGRRAGVGEEMRITARRIRGGSGRSGR